MKKPKRQHLIIFSLSKTEGLQILQKVLPIIVRNIKKNSSVKLIYQQF